MCKKVLLLVSASTLILYASAANAQQAVLPAASENAAQGEGQEVPDIIVTAQRREQRLQDVPLAVAAIGGEAVTQAGVSGMSQLQAVVPNLVVNRVIGAANPFLRGIGFVNGDNNTEASVAIYVDGVYQPSSYINFFEFNNIERIEVLKGPQGTLFGRNATGGVVQVITKKPSYTTQADFQIGYANYETVRASGYVSGKLAEGVAANLAVQYADQGEGWGRNLTTGSEVGKINDFNIRGKLLIEPTDRTSILVSGTYYDFKHSLAQQAPKGATVGPDLLPYADDYNGLGNIDSSSNGKGHGISVEVNHDFGKLQLRSISAYSKYMGHQFVDQDMSPSALINAFFDQDVRMITQELHLLSPTDSKVQWLVGAFYFNKRASVSPLTLTGAFLDPLPGLSTDASVKTESIAAFAQAVYPLTDTVNLTGGIRYTHDKSDYAGSVSLPNGPVIIPLTTSHYSDGRPTWRMTLDHSLTPDALVYVSYNRGVKAGGFTVTASPDHQESFAPEKLDAFELGLKTQLLNRTITFNTAAFYYDFANIQFQRIDAGVVRVVNGPKARLWGVEAEIDARVGGGLSLYANGSYLNTHIGDFPQAPSSVRLPNGRTAAGDPLYNAEGNQLPNAPKWSGNVGFRYETPIGAGKLKLSSNLLYAGKTYNELDNRLFVKEHAVVNASVGFETRDGLSLTVFGQNLTDSRYATGQVGQAGFSDMMWLAAPRTYGVMLGYAF